MKQARSKESPFVRQGTKLFLIDGSSFCYRAYYAIRSLSNSKGEPTNAIYGFITMMRKLIQDTQPDYLAMCFDRKEPTFRHKQYKEYKAHRKPMPEDLVQQLEPIKEFCRAYRFPLFELAGYEADDLIGTLAKKGEKEGLDVFIVTGDKDAMQLVDDKIKILNPHKENLIFDTEAVKKRFDGIGPDKVVDLMALMGDASDNIPGVPGIGEKTAIRLIQEFGSVENLLEHVGRVRSKPQQALLKENEKSALLSKDLARIDTGVPLSFDWDDIKIKPPDEEKLVELCKHYEFRALLKEHTGTGEAREAERRYRTVTSEKDLKALVNELKNTEAFSFDTETTSADPMCAHLVGMSFAWKDFHASYIPVSSKRHKGEGLAVDQVLGILKSLLESDSPKKYGQNIKYDWIVMKRHGINLNGVAFDTMIASYLINPLKMNHNLDDISLEYLSVKKITTQSLLGKGKTERTMDEVPVEDVSRYACEDADCVFRLVPILKERLEALEIFKLFCDLEMPLARILAKMEMNGVHLDLKFLAKLSEKAGEDLKALTHEIYREAGEEFNINSTKQLSEILFVKMKLPIIRRTKTGYSTDESVLQKLALTYELPKRILEYREKSKLKSTYLDALPAMIHEETGRIHTSYNQATTATGRLSSSDPNLQNIPIKTEAGREIRRAFIARARQGQKGKILAADYSQVELRILAHLSGDPNLTKAFEGDRDIHRFTATLLYGTSEKDVTREMRNVAKTINFSIIYGKTAYGLSQDLGISVSEADGFIEQYFKRYSGIRDYLEAQKEKARQAGYLTTILGRRSYFPEIHSKNMQIRQFAERAAINAPIQGSAADLVKLAMIAIDRRLEAGFKDAYMTMQVHDELVFDVAEDGVEELAVMVRESMEKAYTLRVPLKVDIFTGDSWYKN
ncbi:MAG TPA: DNA polymerase I [bacterium]|nr:DNA polymerase I [bacterium]